MLDIFCLFALRVPRTLDPGLIRSAGWSGIRGLFDRDLMPAAGIVNDYRLDLIRRGESGMRDELRLHLRYGAGRGRMPKFKLRREHCDRSVAKAKLIAVGLVFTESDNDIRTGLHP